MEQWGSDGPVIGIDLGTTYSCAAVWKNNKVEVIPNDQGHRITPSMVAFNDGERIVGDGAKNRSSSNPEKTIFDAKRLIGRGWSDSHVQNDMKSWPFKLIAGRDDKPMIVVHDQGNEKLIAAEEISAAVLCKMKDIAEAFLGCPVKRAVVTVPAYFSDSQRQSTKAAGTIAGLDVIRIINEPTAAALAYGLDLKESGQRRLKKVLVFDLGGGTFDVSILEIENGIVEVKATGGDTHLGGEDFDSRMVSHFAQEFKKKYKHDVMQNARSLRRLRTELERGKRNLSNTTVERIEVDCLMEGIDFHSTVTRAKFEDLNMDFFARCMEILEQCLKDAKMDRQSIDDVVLVGGSSRIVKIREMLEEFFNRKDLCKSLNADEAVAFGAAIHGAMLGGVNCSTFNNIVLCDVAPLSLGTSDYLGLMKVFIPRNTRVPTTVNQIWTLVRDYLTSTTYHIYEGERTMANDNNLLGELHLSGITPAPAGESTIKVIFSVDNDGILNISAEDLTSGKKAETTISNNHGRLSPEDMERMIQDSRKFKLEDEKKKRRADARSDLESYVLTTRNTVKYSFTGSRMPAKEKQLLEKALERAMQWSEEEDPSLDEDDYRDKKKELQDLCRSLQEKLHL